MDDNYKFEMFNMKKFKNKKIACLTLDLEQDHGGILEEPHYDAFPVIDPLIKFLDSKNIPLTCFVQGSLFETHLDEIRKFKKIQTEFELHAFHHKEYCEIDHEKEIKLGKDAYEEFFNCPPLAYRSQAGSINHELFSTLSKQGFKFDSSLIPAFRPGVYNAMKYPSNPHFLPDFQLLELPLSTYSKFRIPITLSYIKLLGKLYFYLLKMSYFSDLFIFSFHLHDLVRIQSSQKIPMNKFPLHHQIVFKRIYGSDNGMSMFKSFVNMLIDKGYTFLTLKDVYQSLMEEK